MTEEKIFGLARCLIRTYKIYKRQNNDEAKEIWLNNLKAYCFTFKTTCDEFYNDNKSAPEWLRYISKIQKNRVIK